MIEKDLFDGIRQMISQQQIEYKNIAVMVNESVRAYTESIAKIKISIPTLPMFKIPEGFMDDFYKDCLSNAEYGWCLSSQMNIPSFRSIANELDTQEVKDYLFSIYFELDNSYLYRVERDFIISSASESWKQLYKSCFETIEAGRYIVVIPTFITAIEHEIATMHELSDLYGRRLLKRTKVSMGDDEKVDTFSSAIGLSIIAMLLNGIFENHPFNGERKPLLNRNWILHGRDDPQEWTKTDIYRLMSIISALRIVRS